MKKYFVHTIFITYFKYQVVTGYYQFTTILRSHYPLNGGKTSELTLKPSSPHKVCSFHFGSPAQTICLRWKRLYLSRQHKLPRQTASSICSIHLSRSLCIYLHKHTHTQWHREKGSILWSGVGLRKAKLGFWVWYKKLFVAMVERRKPLVLSSTKLIINSVLTSSSSPPPQLADRVEDDVSSGTLQLRAGILRFPRDKIVISSHHSNLSSLDDAALVGLSTCALKRLSITSASMVIKNISISSIKLGLVVEKIKEKETI